MSLPKWKSARGWALLMSVMLAAVGIGLVVHSILAKSVDSVEDANFAGGDRNDFRCTSQPAFVNIPGTAVDFDPDAAGPTGITFTGEFSTDGGTGDVRLRYTVDGFVQVGPGDAEGYRFAVSATTQTITLSFLGANQSGGIHTAAMQWKKTSATPGNVCVGARSLVVFYP